MRANGMIARPPNCNRVPNQMYGTRRHPRAERCVSERKPISARNGANNSGSATMAATSQLGTPSSTIITRLSVPLSRTTAMPTDTWNSDNRIRRPSGSSAVAASANGRKRTPTRIHPRAMLMPSAVMRPRAPGPATYRSRWRCGPIAQRARRRASAQPPAFAQSPPRPPAPPTARGCHGERSARPHA